MGRIRLLPDEVASQVAAGEVVERPASVVKELVENSIDAGARRIEVEYQRGGTAFLRVGDDGCGMDREDALLCLERHATSKIRVGADLARIETMGFRGEALPSIASVSRFRLVTRERGAEAGTEVVVAGGKIETVKDSGDGYGTRIEVRSLFFNLPARRKFLRGERTEAAQIDHQVQTLALANPGLAFSLVKDGRTAFLLAPAEGLATRVRDLLGTDAAAKLVEMPEVEIGGIIFSGLLASSGHGRPDRTQQFVFVNGRPVQSTAIWQPLREAYGSSIERNLHPPVVLFVRMDPEQIDCNVHPAKREVRFQDPTRVREAVYEAVRRAMDAGRSRVTPLPSWKSSPGESGKPAENAARVPAPEAAVSPAKEPGTPAVSGARAAEPAERVEPTGRILPVRQPVEEARSLAMPEAAGDERFRFVGRLAERYLVMEDDSGMVLLDNRAARERILFETLLRQMRGDRGVSQRLLIPAVVELPPRDFAWVRENAALLGSAGIVVEPFGVGAVKVDSIPPMLARWAPGDLLVRMADDCRVAGKQARHRLAEEVVARSISGNAALAALPGDEAGMRRLLAELMRCDLPYACPQGRPTMIHFAFTELDRKFGRAR